MTTSSPETSSSPPSLDLRGIGWFLGLCFGMTWAFEIAVFVLPGVHLEENPPPWATAVLPIAMLFPAIAAFITRRWITREGFASAGLRKGSWRPYLYIWALTPLLFAAVYVVPALFGLGRFDPGLTQFEGLIRKTAEAAGSTEEIPSGAAPWYIALILGSMTSGILFTSIFTFGEEFGWTGYLTVKLRPLGKWPTALLYGIIWGLWHAPLIVIGLNYPGHPVLGIALMCVFTTVLGFTQLALRLRYDSVFLPTFLHACINTQAMGVFPNLAVGVDPLLGGIAGLVGIAALAPIGVWLLATTSPCEKPTSPVPS